MTTPAFQYLPLIIVDEITSVIEDMTNTTNKHPKENQQALRWFAERCEKWVGLDAHLMNTSVVLCQEYFKEDIRVLINHSRGARKDAVLIPKPQWTDSRECRIRPALQTPPIKRSMTSVTPQYCTT